MIEILSMLGGGVAGFVMRFMAMQAESQANLAKALVEKQNAVDESHDKAAARVGSHVGRRVLVFTILWVLCIAPIFAAILGIPTYIETERAPWDLLGLFSGGWDVVYGVVILPEMRAALLAAVGFYLGGSSISRGR